MHFIDTSGVFLQSPSNTFHAVIDSLGTQQPDDFYFSVVHVASATIVWSANRGAPVGNVAELVLSAEGLSLSISDGRPPVWSTPRLAGAVSAMRLADTGNLLLLGRGNTTLWESFNQPTDTCLPTRGPQERQRRRLPPGYERLRPLSPKRRRRGGVADESPLASLRIGKLDSDGRLRILSYTLANSSTPQNEFVAPADDCDLPVHCAALAVCTEEQSSCSCPQGFTNEEGGCVPSDGSRLSSPSSCGGTTPGYYGLPTGMDYFAKKFRTAAATGVNLPACQSLCSQNCSCVGFYHRNSTGSCFLLEAQLNDGDLGFVKVLPPASPLPASSRRRNLPTYILPILLPSISVFLLVVLVAIILVRMRLRRREARSRYPSKEIKLGRFKSWPPSAVDGGDDKDDGDDDISIPGLPTRFSYEELRAATDDFRTRIGSGGFGEVFKGVLSDSSAVAVKRIINAGAHGKRDFCTEIAVIGNIHHVNLVKLRGFCVQGSRRLLVYEYMSRSSLDRSLFAGRGSPVLEWRERVEIALGTARGLAYLHGGCDHKIIHCDVKPENILLSDQLQAKITDFGLSKLLSPEQSAFFTTMRGTRGYLAPEWLTNSSISDRTDVYSYGMVLLEIVRGRKNLRTRRAQRDSKVISAENSASGSSFSSSAAVSSGGAANVVYFPMHALEMHERGRYLELADPRLEGRVEAAEVEKVVRVALCCLHEDPALRPAMATVVGMLEGTMPVPTPLSAYLNFLRFYGRNFSANPGTPATPATPAQPPAVGHGGFYGRTDFTATVASTGTTNSTSKSYLSAQQLSGPR
ncbi:unnamed protein product [Spirodela intermedia]|uniref:Receptor-like serine/threonine-protein kinase n=1 Tax=Spirodela intermedia TaxID=51605 RepID=A0A7I8J4B6_SPIIN|nr:unnamed protein product [Spirodela intermedia]CAA6664949.1 unnamed protein product [Spirodela intermedia]